MSKLGSCWPCRFLCLVLGFSSLSAQPIPDVDLDATVRQVDDGVKSNGLHLLRLICKKDACTLVTVTLNQCVPVKQDLKLSTPKIDVSSTAALTLRVKVVNRNELDVSEVGSTRHGDYTATFRFTYERAGGTTRTKAFSGALIKNSDLLRKVITIRYEPLQANELLEFECPVLVPGIE